MKVTVIADIGHHTEKSLGVMRSHAVIRTLVKEYHLTLV